MKHSQTEKRYYCFGKVGGGIMTVRFTWRENVIRIIGAGYWRKGKKKIQYSNEPIGEVRILNDFLPSPGELAFKEKKVKVTMTLSQASVDFFKAEAKKHHTSYQAMIRQLLDIYASQQRS